MYGLVKKNDGTYALTEFVHYGKGHLDGGHSGRYPWGSRLSAITESTKAKTVSKDHIKNVRFESKEEKKSYLPPVKDLRTAVINLLMSDKYAKLSKANALLQFNLYELSSQDSGLDLDRSNPAGYDALVRDSKVYISGSEKISDEKSRFFRKELPPAVRMMIDYCMINDAQIVTGDNKGIDSYVQDYLNKTGYKNAVIYTPEEKPRYLANKKWKVVNNQPDGYAASRSDTAIVVTTPLKSDNNHSEHLLSTDESERAKYGQQHSTMVYSLTTDPNKKEFSERDLNVTKRFNRDLIAEGRRKYPKK